MECKGCAKGIKMCYNRPCLGTPEEFEAIMDAGFTDKLRVDYWIGNGGREPITQEMIDDTEDEQLKNILRLTMELTKDSPVNPHKEDVEFICGGTERDQNFRTRWLPSGRCNLLDENDLCILHSIDLKPEQGRKACCKEEFNEAADSNLPYVNLWATDKGREVVDRFKKLVGINDES
jgi:hypothetical protein